MKTSSVKKLNRSISFGGVSLTQRALLAKHLAVMLRSGLTIIEALSIAADAAEGRLKPTLGGVLKAVETGRSLSSSFSDYPRVFSGLFTESVRAGEASGQLAENLESVAQELEKEKELTAKVTGALVYPGFILVATFILGIFMSFVVLPKIIPLFEGLKIDLPMSTRALIWFAHLIQNDGVWLLLGLVFFIFFFVWLIRQNFIKPVTHWIFLHTPLIKRLVMGANLARFSRTLGTLLKSGINIDEALDITASSTGNFYYRRALEDVSVHISKGGKLAESLESHKKLFPKIVTRMVQVGEESGRFEETLLYLANFYEEGVDTTAKSLSTIIEPMLLLIIGIIVVIFALAIITPIYELTGNIQR